MKILLTLLTSIFLTKNSFAVETNAKQALLFDQETKTIIFEKNADDLMSPSSMSKIMTIYLRKIQRVVFILD